MNFPEVNNLQYTGKVSCNGLTVKQNDPCQKITRAKQIKTRLYLVPD